MKSCVASYKALSNLSRRNLSNLLVHKSQFSNSVSPKFWSFISRKFKPKEKIPDSPAILEQNDLFHPFVSSPIKDVQLRGELIRNHGVCPTCLDEAAPEPTMVTPQSIAKSQRPIYNCPDCGLPTHCSESHYKEGYENHKKYCSILREINEDEHDLRSGRKFPEFKFPGPSFVEAASNLSTWDTFFVTRNFRNVDSQRSVRHVSKLLTYPLTIGSVLHPYGPHQLGANGLTLEGSKSLAALHYTMEKEEPAPKGSTEEKIKQQIRVFILGARAEAQLPPYSYLQLCYLFPNVSFQMYFIGPEALPPSGVPEKVVFNSHLSFNYLTGLFHDVYHQAVPFDPYHDIFFMFSPGISYPYTQQLWHQSIALLLETKCPIFITGYDDADLKNDAEQLEKTYSKEMDWLLKPRLNPFRSMKADLNLQDVRMTLNANHGIMGIRGKRYEVRPQ